MSAVEALGNFLVEWAAVFIIGAVAIGTVALVFYGIHKGVQVYRERRAKST